MSYFISSILLKWDITPYINKLCIVKFKDYFCSDGVNMIIIS